MREVTSSNPVVVKCNSHEIDSFISNFSHKSGWIANRRLRKEYTASKMREEKSLSESEGKRERLSFFRD